jgi:amidase
MDAEPSGSTEALPLRTTMLVSSLWLALTAVTFAVAAPSKGCNKKLDLYKASVEDLLQGLSCGAFTSTECVYNGESSQSRLKLDSLVRTYMSRIKEVNHLNAGVTAVIEVSPTALADAAASDKRYKSKRAKPLEGVRAKLPVQGRT